MKENSRSYHLKALQPSCLYTRASLQNVRRGTQTDNNENIERAFKAWREESKMTSVACMHLGFGMAPRNSDLRLFTRSQ